MLTSNKNRGIGKIITLSIISIVVIFVFSITKTSNAQIGVPISTMFDYQSVMNFQKNFTLDRVATLAAKQILHQITASVVNWINSGFEGSPLFLTNPGAFFLDVADQVTGAFLATNGPLSSLCSPFAIDIRLSLALSQTSMVNQRYTCTLGKIIEAQKGGPDIIVNGQIVRSSQKGFLAGDFNQGGWPAFIALTTEQQNNPYSAFLKADADLRAQIINKQNVIRADINLGQGFMSWSDCKDISTEEGSTMIDVDPSVRKKTSKDGKPRYQTCEVKTPGSVISGTLQKNLNVPVTELELADDINAIVNALVTQMMKKMIGGGLGSLSGNSGGGSSYTQQIIEDSYSGLETQQTLEGLQDSIANAIIQVEDYLYLYTKATKDLEDAQSNLISAKNCFLSKNNTGRWNNKVSHIDSTIDTKIRPLLTQIEARQVRGRADKDKLTKLSLSLAGTGSASSVQAKLAEYNSFVQSGGLYIQQNHEDARTMLSDVEKLTKNLNGESEKLSEECALATPF